MSTAHQLCHSPRPGLGLRSVRRMVGYVAAATEGLQVVEVIRRAAGLERPHVVNFQDAGLAALTTPAAITFQDLQADRCPAPFVERLKVLAPWSTPAHRFIPYRSCYTNRSPENGGCYAMAHPLQNALRAAQRVVCPTTAPDPPENRPKTAVFADRWDGNRTV